MNKEDLMALTADIVSSHVSNNSVPLAELPSLIEQVYATLGALGSQDPAISEPAREPAVPIRKSVTPDHIICLEDGKKLKMLKRYIKTRFDLTPEQYRERWGLAADYPMVAPNYAKQRRDLAKNIGLGKARGKRG
ncbi:MAG: MucR family transcriptional regulator [Rhodothalassiaceae bacterium]